MNNNNNVLIRPIQAGDALQAARVWADGLEQSIETSPPEKKELYRKYFHESRDKEFAEGGEIGPDGMGLLKKYGSLKNRDTIMFVAVKDEQVLGLVGVKRGMDSKDIPNATADDYTLFSIWKLSVAAAGRRLGIRQKLMEAAEIWVRNRPDATAIRLYTGNPIAAKFHTSPKVGFVEIEKTDHYGVYEKKLQKCDNAVYRYSTNT